MAEEVREKELDSKHKVQREGVEGNIRWFPVHHVWGIGWRYYPDPTDDFCRCAWFRDMDGAYSYLIHKVSLGK